MSCVSRSVAGEAVPAKLPSAFSAADALSPADASLASTLLKLSSDVLYLAIFA
jgi:hypothetical protein